MKTRWNLSETEQAKYDHMMDLRSKLIALRDDPKYNNIYDDADNPLWDEAHFIDKVIADVTEVLAGLENKATA
jgi:hypothetical protein